MPNDRHVARVGAQFTHEPEAENPCRRIIAFFKEEFVGANIDLDAAGQA